MSDTKTAIRDALASVQCPDGNTTLDQSLEWIASCDGFVSLKFHLKSTNTQQNADIYATIARRAHEATGIALAQRGEQLRSLIVEFVDHAGSVINTQRLGAGPAPSDQTQPHAARTPSGTTHAQRQAQGHTPIGGLNTPADNPLASIKHIIAVGAGKGGVGKSTVAVNLAVGLAKQGHAVGLLDGDIYGPSLPTMLGLDAMEQTVLGGMLQPHAVHGIKAMTIGKLVEPDKPLIWRGPMAHGAFKQLIEQTQWGELEYLIIDLPPGTGDVCLTLAQSLSLTGAVVVCTPQKVAQDDAVRAARMFAQLKIEVLGVVENMSYFLGDDGKAYDIFGRGGAELMAQRMGLPFLGALPINMALRANSDSGEPLKNFDPATAGGPALPDALHRLIETLSGQIALASIKTGKIKPSLTIHE